MIVARKSMPESNLEFIEKCVIQWKGEFPVDERLKEFSEKFDKWIMQIPKDRRDIVKTLILNMSYYSNETANKWLKNLHNDLLMCDNVTDDNTIYVFIKSNDGLSNSSNDYWTNYKAINRINKNLCVENMNAITEYQWGFIDNIVFIDDFSGTGKSFIKELKRNPKRYSGKRVFFIALNIMQFAIDNINDFASKHKIEIVFLISDIQKKAFERKLFSNESKIKKDIEAMSEKFKIPKHEILGFEESESLVAFYNNTPNNTLGFIRYDTDSYCSIFPRRDDPKPVWQQFDRTKQNKKVNYNNKLKGTKK